jgi:hypothetical protein
VSSKHHGIPRTTLATAASLLTLFDQHEPAGPRLQAKCHPGSRMSRLQPTLRHWDSVRRPARLHRGAGYSTCRQSTPPPALLTVNSPRPHFTLHVAGARPRVACPRRAQQGLATRRRHEVSRGTSGLSFSRFGVDQRLAQRGGLGPHRGSSGAVTIQRRPERRTGGGVAQDALVSRETASAVV